VKVEGPKSSSATGGVQRSRSTGGTSATSGNFAAELDSVTGTDEAGAPSAVEGGTGVAGVSGILAAQSVNDQQQSAGERRRKAQRGAEMLEKLEEIRKGLLLGRIPKDRLAELARTVREKRERGTDPVLARLLDEIELRAAVELAKLGLPGI
jgi:hypothetical protein